MTSGFTPPLRWRQHQTSKRGLSTAEMEDVVRGDDQSGCFAVADGATQTLRAGRRVTLLTERFITEPIFSVSPDEWAEWLKPIRQQWWQEIREIKLPWYAEHKLPDGAGAIFVGFCLLTMSRHQESRRSDCTPIPCAGLWDWWHGRFCKVLSSVRRCRSSRFIRL